MAHKQALIRNYENLQYTFYFRHWPMKYIHLFIFLSSLPLCC
jgi:hypothetical protein